MAMKKASVAFTVTADDVTSVTLAAKELKVNRITVYRWIRSKKIIPVSFGGTYYIPVTEIERLRHG